jgi:hypothetical protein
MKLQLECTGITVDNLLHTSCYPDSNAYYWIAMKDFNYFFKNLAEYNNIQAKRLMKKLEEDTNLMDLYLTSLKQSLSSELEPSQTEVTLQKWKLEQLEELCVGPCLENQRYVTKREYLSIFDFDILNKDLPRNVNHLRYKRDLSLVNFYLSVLEGGDPSIK